MPSFYTTKEEAVYTVVVKEYDLSQENIVRLVFSLLTKQVKVKVILMKMGVEADNLFQEEGGEDGG